MAKQDRRPLRAVAAPEPEQVVVPEPAAPVTPPVEPDRWVKQCRYVDSLSKPCRLVQMTPAVCDVCGFDAADRFGAVYAELTEGEQATARVVLSAHRREYHEPGEAPRTITRQWLGKE